MLKSIFILGKTIAAEIAMFKVFRDYPEGKVVYIAPMKALVRERMDDWRVRLQDKLGKSIVELTGDITPDVKAILKASVIVTTPEKWDAGLFTFNSCLFTFISCLCIFISGLFILISCLFIFISCLFTI